MYCSHSLTVRPKVSAPYTEQDKYLTKIPQFYMDTEQRAHSQWLCKRSGYLVLFTLIGHVSCELVGPGR